jgi:hypothetical protein
LDGSFFLDRQLVISVGLTQSLLFGPLGTFCESCARPLKDGDDEIEEKNGRDEPDVEREKEEEGVPCLFVLELAEIPSRDGKHAPPWSAYLSIGA